MSGHYQYGFESEDTDSQTDEDTEIPTDITEYCFEPDSDSDVTDYGTPIYYFNPE